MSDALEDTSCPLLKIINVLADRCSILTATTRGRTMVRKILSELVENFRQDKWFESLCVGDFLIFDFVQCCIIKSPVSLSLPSFGRKTLSDNADKMSKGKVDNLNNIWTIIEQHYTVDGQLPINFTSLKRSLTKVSTDNVKEPWFLDYLEHLFALNSSMARRIFVCAGAKACRMFNLATDPNLKPLLASLVFGSDWRKPYISRVTHC